MAFAEDFAAYLADFGEVVSLAGEAVTAIFDLSYQPSALAITDVSDAGPALTLPTSDVPDGVVGAAVVARSVSYKVVEHMPDGTGYSILRLRGA